MAGSLLAPIKLMFLALYLHNLSLQRQYSALEDVTCLNGYVISPSLLRMRMNEVGLLVNETRRTKPTSLPHNSGSMALRLIILSGDIAQNPGPKYRYPCSACSKPVKSNQKGIHCDSCDTWYHTKCCSISDESYDNLVNVSGSWICCKCDVPNFARSLTSSAEIPEENFYQPLSSLVSSPSGYASTY